MKHKLPIITTAAIVACLCISQGAIAASLKDKVEDKTGINTEDLETPEIEKPESFGVEFETLQQEMIDRIDLALDKLIKWENKVSANTYISEATEVMLMEALEDVHTNVHAYKMAVNDAESMEDLRTINKELLLYLQENKDVIRETVKGIAVALGEEALQYSEQVMDAIEYALNILARTCKEEADTIEETEVLLEDLDELLDSLELAVDSEDVQQIKSDVKDIITVTTELYENLETLETNCLM